MKAASFFRLGLVLTLFIIIQGWLLARMFVAPRVFQAAEAHIMGETIDVRAPVAGYLGTAIARQGERVEKGQLLFIITRTVLDPDTQRLRAESLPIHASRAGIITSVLTVRGTSVASDQKLLTLVDDSPEALSIYAHLPMAPTDVYHIQPQLNAQIAAEFLYGGKPIEARITSVDPVYNHVLRTLGVRLQLLRAPGEMEELPLGLPVTAEVYVERESNDNPVITAFRWIFPPSQARHNR